MSTGEEVVDPRDQTECYSCGVPILMGDCRYSLGFKRLKSRWNCKPCEDYGKEEERRMGGI